MYMRRSKGSSKILLIEDEAAIRQVLCFFLKHNGYEVLDVSDGREAIQAIPEFKPDLIILDLVMRPVSGWDVLQWLRRKRLTPRIPVLVVSALTQLKEQIQGFEEGAIEYITKPTQPSLIVERVRAILALNQQQRTMLQHARMDEQRKMFERVYATQPEEFFS
jgi:DNA-binding response OmpR family regulator